MKKFIGIVFFLQSMTLLAQEVIKGRVLSTDNEALSGVNVSLKDTSVGTISDADGYFQLNNLKNKQYTLVFKYMGFRTTEQSVTLPSRKKLEIKMMEDLLGLDQVVVSASREEIPIYKSPVQVNKISQRTFGATNSQNLAQGLNFSPGLRTENNCQNCGFTQLRINGLDGAYSQILVNSRPIFSALASVYGLEMIPPNMIERIEVVKGGGSALYGGNAIGGTVNVITKDPVSNEYSLSYNHELIDGEKKDRTLRANASVVSDDLRKGFSVYTAHRTRDWWDANNDGFSEITQLNNSTFGFDGFYKFNELNKLKVNYFRIDESRRGGNDFELQPHQADIAEDLKHGINSASIQFEHFSKNLAHKLSLYASAQETQRESYYGGGGRIVEVEDSFGRDDLLALNAYGNSQDLAANAGAQYKFRVWKKSQLMLGSEVSYNRVNDQMPGYNRTVQQGVTIYGNFAQWEYDPTKNLCIQAGARFDWVDVSGFYLMENEVFDLERKLPAFVPRLNILYNLHKNWKIRASYAEGYRAPQAFNEDLHIETVGGAAQFIQLDNNLENEQSQSFNLSLDYTSLSQFKQLNVVLAGFYTTLQNPFIYNNARELPSGISIVNKSNGSGATVAGLNLEANLALKQDFILQTGFTAQIANYHSPEEVWSSENSNGEIERTETEQMLRTPNFYGFVLSQYKLNNRFSANLNLVYTGSMLTPHVVNPETERTILETTPSFFEVHPKVNFQAVSEKSLNLNISVGVRNLFNSYQNDFDRGPLRDAGYVYGPAQPRTFFVTLSLNG